MTAHQKFYGSVAEVMLVEEAEAAMLLCGDSHPQRHLRSVEYDRVGEEPHYIGKVDFVDGDKHFRTEVDLHLTSWADGQPTVVPEVVEATVQVKAKQSGEIDYQPQHFFACHGEEALQEVRGLVGLALAAIG